VSYIYGSTDDYKVIVELQPEFQGDPSVLSILYVRSSGGQLVPLDTVAQLKFDQGPLTVNHQNQFPSVTLSFNPKPGVALSEAVGAVEQVAAATLPPTVNGQLRGSAQAFRQSMGNLFELIVFALLVIYIILGILYESFIHPLTILSGLPAAALGGLLTLRLFGRPLDFYSFVGIIMLIGIVKKNAIMVIDFAIAGRRAGKKPFEAVYDGCLVRLRPIMMTTVAATMGALPIAVGVGAGGESRQPLGLVVVGGLLFSQVVTLYLMPVFYLYMEQLQEWLGWHLGVGAPAEAPAAS